MYILAMNIEPKNLNIPLEQKEHWGIVLLMAGAVAVGISAMFSPSFAIALAASGIVGLPVLWLLFFPPHLVTVFMRRGRLSFGQVGIYLLLFTYLALSKKVLVPFVAEVIERVFLLPLA